MDLSLEAGLRQGPISGGAEADRRDNPLGRTVQRALALYLAPALLLVLIAGGFLMMVSYLVAGFWGVTCWFSGRPALQDPWPGRAMPHGPRAGAGWIVDPISGQPGAPARYPLSRLRGRPGRR